MEIKKSATAGTVESSDIMITIQPASTQKTITLDLDSSVEKQFGKQIRHVILSTLKHLNVTSADVIAVDKGALDAVIQARTITAVHRAVEKENYDWKEIDSWNV